MPSYSWYLSDVEVLTETGFVTLSKLDAHQLVASVTNDAVDFVTPMAVVHRKLSLPCVNFTRDTQAGKFFATLPLDNEMLIGFRDLGALSADYRVKVKDIKNETTRSICSNAPSSGSRRELPTCVDRLNIALQADGRVNRLQRSENYRTVFKFSKDRKYERLMTILEQVESRVGGISWTETESDVYTVSILTDFTVHKHFHEWVNFANKSQTWLKFFIREMSQWDGSIAATGMISYGSVCKSDVDMVQAAATLCGWIARLSYDAAHDFYSITIDPSKRFTRYRFNRSTPEVHTADWHSVISKYTHDGFILRSNGFLFIGA